MAMPEYNNSLADVSTETKQVAVIKLNEDEATALRNILEQRPMDNRSTIHDDLAYSLATKLRAEGF